MKIAFLLTISTLFFQSCTTYRKTLIYSSSAGCLGAGSTAIALARPRTQKNLMANGVLWCAIGGIVTGGIGHILYKDDPRNQRLDNMLFEKPVPPPPLKEKIDLLIPEAKINE